MSEKKNIRHSDYSALENYFAEMGEKKFRVKQVWEWLWQKHAHSFDEMTNLSKELRSKLSENFFLPALRANIFSIFSAISFRNVSSLESIISFI